MNTGKCLMCEIKLEKVDGIFPVWCSINCKKNFYLKYFLGNSDVALWEREFDEEFKKRQKRVMKEIKESGLSVRDFLLSLGDFKEDSEKQNGKRN